MNMELGELLGIGRTAEVYSFDENKAVKLFYPDIPTEKIRQEGSRVRELTVLGISTPKVIDFVSIGNREGIVFEKVEGQSLTRYLTRKPWCAKSLGRSMAALHSEMHKHSVSALFEQRNNFIGKIRLSSKFLGGRSEQIIDYYKTLPMGKQLCHGDFHPKNILVDKSGMVVIDWPDAYAGNCLGDVARTLLILQSPELSTSMPSFLGRIARPIRKQMYTAYLKAYINMNGTSLDAIQSWLLPVAASRLVDGVSNEQEWLMNIVDRQLKLR